MEARIDLEFGETEIEPLGARAGVGEEALTSLKSTATCASSAVSASASA